MCLTVKQEGEYPVAWHGGKGEGVSEPLGLWVVLILPSTSRPNPHLQLPVQDSTSVLFSEAHWSQALPGALEL